MNPEKRRLRRLALRIPELILVLFGCLLRIVPLGRYRPEQGYDFWEHSATMEWWAQHFQMPPLLLSRGSYHPQSYYLLGGLLRRLGGSFVTIQAASVVVGCVRLGLLWWAAERYLKNQRVARLLLLALAAVMPMSVQMDIMMTQEPLNNLLAVIFVVVTLELCRAPDAKRFRWGVLLGVVTGLGLLTKVSNLLLLGVIGSGAMLEVIQRSDLDLFARLKRVRPWLAAVGVAVVMSGPQYAYNHVVYGKAMMDGWYKRPTEDTTKAGASKRELLDRRTLGYVLGFSPDVIRQPYYPSGLEPSSRFWSALIVTAYSDYFVYGFVPTTDVGAPVSAAGRSVGSRATAWGRASVAGGVGIAVLVLTAWVWAAWTTLWRREIARPTVLVMPLLGLFGALYFAIQYPYDFEGVVKAHYFHFVSPALYALFGLSVAWLLRHRWLQPLGWAGIALVVPVAVYSSLCAFK